MYKIGSLNIDILYVSMLLIFCHILLEVFERVYPKSNNEFSNFFFWFIYIILFISLYLAVVQTFISSVTPKDFLLKTDYISVQVVYSSKYMLEYFFRYLEILIQVNKLELRAEIITLIHSIHITTRIETITSLEDLQKLVVYCVELAHEVFYTSGKVITYNPERDPIMVSILISLLKFAFVLKFSCYNFPYFIVHNIPENILLNKYLLKNIYRDFLQHWLQTKFPDLIFEMTNVEFYDFCTALMPWLLKHYPPSTVLREVIIYLFS